MRHFWFFGVHAHVEQVVRNQFQKEVVITFWYITDEQSSVFSHLNFWKMCDFLSNKLQ